MPARPPSPGEGRGLTDNGTPPQKAPAYAGTPARGLDEAPDDGTRDDIARLKEHRAAQEKQRAAREKAAAKARADAADAAETAREARLRALSGRRAQKPEARSPQIKAEGTTVDQAIRSLMRHSRYWRDKEHAL